MRFLPTPLPGAYVVAPERLTDARGHFARTWCQEAFAAMGLCTELVQGSVSYNARRGTLRGMHYQAAPHEEAKLVRCARGAIFDVILDLRADSPTRGRWHGLELSAENGLQLYVPAGVAHGFQTLVDDTEVAYQMSAAYAPGSARGVRWDDPAFGIAWPAAEAGRVMSERDASYPDWRP